MTANLLSTTNIVDVIRYWVTVRADAEVLRFYPLGEGEFSSHSFAEFNTRCEAIASQLQAYRGQRAILLFNSGIEFLEALFACFYAGVIAVPAYPPRRNHNLGRLQTLVDDCEPSLFLSTEQVITQAKPLCEEAFSQDVNSLPWIETDSLDNKLASDYKSFSPNEGDLAFLQYTSGSTGSPKGVMVSHKNLMCNIRMSEKAFAIPATSRCVSWLPLFHDMGLIGAVMTPLYWGAGAVLMPPAAFLQKPLRWLKLLDEYGKLSPVGCPAPNFAYQLCVDQISDEDAAKLDLSNYIFALNGAEPIRSSTIDAFCAKFKKSGFNRTAFVPSFGMAETTLISTCHQHGEMVIKNISADRLKENQFVEDVNSSMQMVSSGTNCDGQTLRIVDPDSLQVLDDNHVGELWLAGDHIAQGYWDNITLNQEIFQAVTADNQGPFMRTGDLACRSEGEIFITGRLKDLLIIRGRNHYPQDIELTASTAAEGLHLDNAAAFTIDENGEDKLIILQEVLRSHRSSLDIEATAKIMRNAIAREHGLEASAIIFIRFASIPKTSSGKIQHYVCKQQYINDELKVMAQWHTEKNSLATPKIPQKPLNETTAQELEQWIRHWLAAKAKLDVEEIPLTDAIDGLGLDSIDLVQLTAELENWLGHPIDNMLVWEQPHIQALAEKVLALSNTTPIDAEDDEIEGFL